MLKPLVRVMEKWNLAPSVIEAAIRAEVPDGCLEAALVPEDDGFPAHSVEENRNTTMTQWGGAMRGIGWSADAIMAALLEANAVHCSPPLDEAEAEKVARSVSGYPQGSIGSPFRSEVAISWLLRAACGFTRKGRRTCGFALP